MKNKIYSFLGLAQKAGKVVSGEESCEKTAKEGKCLLLIVAEDASENTMKNISNLAKFHKVEFRVFGEKDDIGRYVGKGCRAFAGITDAGFANQLVKLIDNYASLKDGGEVNG